MYDFILQVTNIDKQFPGVHALKDVSFSVLRGEVHGLIGENGAGKSTLIKSITGAYSYDSGSIIFIDETGTQFKIHNPSDAKAAGIAAAYQDLLAAPELTVGENFFLGRIPKTSLGAVDWSYIYQYSSTVLREYGISVDPRKKMRQLTVSQQMMVTIAKLSSEHAKLIIFDEPTALLPNQEVQTFYKILRKLRANGVSMIYVLDTNVNRFVMFAMDIMNITPDACITKREYALLGIKKMEAFFSSLNMPTSLHDLGIDATDNSIQLMAANCTNGNSHPVGSFRPLDSEDIKKILIAAK